MKKAEKEIYLKNRLIEMQEIENHLYEKGINVIGGVDEVGRGPLAGPVVAACVVLPKKFDIIGIDDSKKLTEKKREHLFDIIKKEALAYGIGWIDNDEIDKINILEATKLAMKKAIKEADKMLTEKGLAKIDYLLIDALTLKDVDKKQEDIVKGDSKSISIAAASIIAKVTRDRYMIEISEKYPDYGFEKNKGYGTKLHYEGIDKVGICDIHRKTFLKNVSY